MLRDQRTSLQQLERNELLEIASKICHDSIEVFPIFECVKVFARLNESGQFTYARVKEDVASNNISLLDVCSRLKSHGRRQIVESALLAFEKFAADVWPFAPGSSSWIQLEILHPEISKNSTKNVPTILFRRACRLSTLESSEPQTSPLLERMFVRMSKTCPESSDGFSVVFRPSFRLKNVAGTGIFTEVLESTDAKAASRLSDAVLLENDVLLSSPGFYFRVGDVQYRVVSEKYTSKKDSPEAVKLPIPIAGWVK